MGEAEAGQWLTLAEVRDRTGRNMDGLRSWAKRGARSGKVRVRKNNKGEVQVLVTPETLTELGEAVTSSGLGDELGVDELYQALVEARAAAAGSAAEARRLEAHLEDIRQTLNVALEHERQEKAQLRAELAAARRGWFERVITAWRRR